MGGPSGVAGISRNLSGISGRTKKEDEYRRTYRLKKEDRVTVYSLPKGKNENLCSFRYRTMSAKASRLHQKSLRLGGRITRVRNANLEPEEKRRELKKLRGQLCYVNRMLSMEIARLPEHAVIIERV